MKTEIKYTFDDDDSEDKLHRLVNADNAFMVISEFQDFLRSEYKYNDDLSEEVSDYIDLLREKLYDLLTTNGIDMDSMWS